MITLNVHGVDHACIPVSDSAKLHADAARWRFYKAHAHDHLDGKNLHDWIAANSLALGGIEAAINEAMRRCGVAL